MIGAETTTSKRLVDPRALKRGDPPTRFGAVLIAHTANVGARLTIRPRAGSMEAVCAPVPEVIAAWLPLHDIAVVNVHQRTGGVSPRQYVVYLYVTAHPLAYQDGQQANSLHQN